MKNLNREYLISFIKESVKFGIVGVLNTLVTLAVIFLLSKVFHFYYLLANWVGYIFGFTNSFIFNKLWTFKSKGDFRREAFFFVLIFIICYIIQAIFLVFFKESLKISADLSQILSMIIYTICGFLGNKIFTFRKI